MEKSKREPKGPIVRFESWQDLIVALRNTYTTSFKDICKTLRASRSWTNQYIKPFIHSVFINSSQRGDTKSGRINWVRVAAIQLQRYDMTESVWFHTDELQAYITDHIVSCTKQTKSVPYTYLMVPNKIEEFAIKDDELFLKMRETRSPQELAALSEERASLPEKYFNTGNPAIKRLLNNRVRITDRTKATAVTVLLPENFMERWKAPHELKDYGDADETIYRFLFRNGHIRIELQLPDQQGKIGTKVFYVPDPDPIHAPYEEKGAVIVTEQAWRQYQKAQGK